MAKDYPNKIKELETQKEAYENDIKQVENNTINNSEGFSKMIIKGVEYADKEQAGKALLEACKNKEEVMKNINLIKEKGSRVGIAIKPETPIEKVYEYLPYIHMCLIMTVEPGKGGQTFITDMTKKIAKLKSYITDNNLDTEIEVDGGINLDNIQEVKNAGADIAVVGTFLINSKDYKDTINKLKI